jgi:hypothetical protein
VAAQQGIFQMRTHIIDCKFLLSLKPGLHWQLWEAILGSNATKKPKVAPQNCLSVYTQNKFCLVFCVNFKYRWIVYFEIEGCKSFQTLLLLTTILNHVEMKQKPCVFKLYFCLVFEEYKIETFTIVEFHILYHASRILKLTKKF